MKLVLIVISCGLTVQGWFFIHNIKHSSLFKVTLINIILFKLMIGSIITLQSSGSSNCNPGTTWKNDCNS